MRLLLDTCTLLWLTMEPDKVSIKALGVFQEPMNTVYFSVVSAWEIAIKYQIGKTRLPATPMRYVSDCIDNYSLLKIDIQLPHAIHAGALPLHHRDPFDRLLIAQADVEGLTIITPDSAFAAYDIPLIW